MTYAPFSYLRIAYEAFDQMFHQFANSILILSYSSNGYSDLSESWKLMQRYKGTVDVFEHAHPYHQ